MTRLLVALVCGTSRSRKNKSPLFATACKGFLAAWTETWTSGIYAKCSWRFACAGP